MRDQVLALRLSREIHAWWDSAEDAIELGDWDGATVCIFESIRLSIECQAAASAPDCQALLKQHESLVMCHDFIRQERRSKLYFSTVTNKAPGW